MPKTITAHISSSLTEHWGREGKKNERTRRLREGLWVAAWASPTHPSLNSQQHWIPALGYHTKVRINNRAWMVTEIRESYPSLCTYLLLTCVPIGDEQWVVDSSIKLSNIWPWLKQMGQKTKVMNLERIQEGRNGLIGLRWRWGSGEGWECSRMYRIFLCVCVILKV